MLGFTGYGKSSQGGEQLGTLLGWAEASETLAPTTAAGVH